jgi:hypothetical protein
MVEVKTEISLREQRRRDRVARLRANRQAKGVRVVPASDQLRRVLKHPNGMGFRPEGSVEWPNDRFTRRRLREGAITLEEDKTKRGGRSRSHDNPPSAA